MNCRIVVICLFLAACKDVATETGMNNFAALKGQPIQAVVEKLGKPDARFSKHGKTMVVWESSMGDEKTADYISEAKEKDPIHYYLDPSAPQLKYRCRVQILADSDGIVLGSHVYGNSKVCTWYGFLVE